MWPTLRTLVCSTRVGGMEFLHYSALAVPTLCCVQRRSWISLWKRTQHSPTGDTARTMSNFFRSMGRSSRPKKSPTLPSNSFEQAQSVVSGAVGPGGQPVSKPLYLCNPFCRSSLIRGSFKTIVVLPKYVDQKEWIAVNRTYLRREERAKQRLTAFTVFDFFNNLNQFYGILTEFCTIQNNPTMSAGVG